MSHHEHKITDQEAKETTNPLDMVAVAETPGELATAIIENCRQADVELGSGPVLLIEAEKAVGAMAGWSWETTNGAITPEYAEARKATILEVVQQLQAIRLAETDPEKPETTKIAVGIRDDLLGGSETLANWVGGIQDDLEVLEAFSTVPELRSAYVKKCHGIAYDLAFGPNADTIVDTLLDGKTTLQQLHALRMVDDITYVMQYKALYDPAEEGAMRIAERLWQYVENDKIAAWMPNAVAESIVNRVRLDRPADDSVAGIAPEVIEEEKDFARGKSFGGDWAKLRPIELAPGVIGARSQYGIIEGASLDAADASGAIEGCTDLKSILEKQGVTVSEDELGLFQELHNPGLQGYLEWQLGNIRLKDLPLAAQFRLVNYAGTRPIEEFNRFVDTVRTMPSAEQAQVLEAFLATEFGDDYGDAILDIAEHAAPEQAGRALETINNLRHHTHEYSHALYYAIDPELAVADEKALNETTTNMLVSLSVVAAEGELHEDVSPGNNVPGHESARNFAIDLESFDESLEVIRGLDETFRTKLAILRADDLRITKVNEDESQFVIYRFMSEKEGNFLWYIRPEGAHGYDRQYEYGNGKGVEASASTIVNPKDPHRLLLPKDPNGVSIRFDREGRQIDEAPDSPNRDPTREDGIISADVSSIMGPADSLPVKIGRMIAAGSRIRARRQGTPDSLHHNTNYFNQAKYGHAAGFADLASKTINQIEMLRVVTANKHLARVATDRALALR